MLNMKRFICIISSIMILTLTSCETNKETESNSEIKSSEVSISQTETENAKNISTGYIIVPDGRKYVRLAESMENKSKIAEMHTGEPITIYSIESDWANISYKGIKGYVELEYISFSEPEITFSQTVITEISESKIETTKSETEKKKEIDISNYYGTWEYEDFTLNISEGSKGTVIELCRVFNGGDIVYDFMVETEHKITSEYIKVNYIDDWENTGYAEFTFKDEKIYVNCVKQKASDGDRGYSLDVSANFSRWEEPVYSTTVYPATDYIGMTVDKVVSMYGNDYQYEYIEGGYFINYSFASGLWIHAGSNAKDYGIGNFDDTVNYVYTYSGTVTDNISIGMTFSQIKSSSGLSFSLEYDDLNGNGYYATVNTNGYSLGMSFDNSYVLKNVLIKKAESTNNASSYTTIENFGYANVDDLRLRATPSLDGEVIGKVTNERSIYIYYKTGDWYYVEFHDGNGNYYDGFAYAEYITIS